MPGRGISPSWPFGRAALVPHVTRQRTQCGMCMGGGEINGLPCYDCDGRGWFDEHNPPPEQEANDDRSVH